jgi:hypothetical protein
MGASAKKERLQQLAGLGPAIARLKEIVAQSGDALLTEGPVHPDYELLDLCATVLHHLSHAQKALDDQYAHHSCLCARSDEILSSHKQAI